MDRSGIPKQLLNDFFKAVSDKKFSEAEKILQEIEGKVESESEFRRGFIQGLKGILYMSRSNEQYTFLSTLNLDNIDLLREYYEEFLENSKKKLRPNYDKGYFLALAEYIHFLLKNVEFRKE